MYEIQIVLNTLNALSKFLEKLITLFFYISRMIACACDFSPYLGLVEGVESVLQMFCRPEWPTCLIMIVTVVTTSPGLKINRTFIPGQLFLEMLPQLLLGQHIHDAEVMI